MSQIKIVENTSEIGAGTRGASLGVGALKVAAHNKRSGFFGKYDKIVVPNQNDLLNDVTEYHYAKRINGLVQVYENTTEVISSVLKDGDFPLVLSGDHACAGGTIAGIKNQFPDKRLGVIWVDAHADIHTPYTTPSGNIHGMPLATALGTDNLDSKVNEPIQETRDFWNKLKNMGGVCPKVLPEDIVFISVRDTEKPEDEFIARNNIKNFSVDEVRTKGLANVASEIRAKLSDCDMVYVSFDVDSMDCILVSKGTGTPVEHGLAPDEAQYLLNDFAKWDKVNCIEVVEINPCLDEKINRMAEVAYDILEEFTTHIQNRI